MVFCFSLPPVRGVLAVGVVCAAVQDLNIASIDSFVKAVSLVLIDAGTRPGIDGAILLAPLAWSYWTVASLVSSSWILSVCANKTVCWSCCSSWAALTRSSTALAYSRRRIVDGSV